MNRTTLVTLLALFFLTMAPGYGQTMSRELIALAPSTAKADESGDQEGPDHDVYKKGYDFILNEKWDAARKQFAYLQEKYPKSTYLDDARYWSAYALMHTDLKKALTSYKEFVNKHPKSTYYGDAVADMANIQAQLEMVTAARAEARTPMPPVGVVTPHAGIAPQIYTLNTKMRHMNRNMRLMNRRLNAGFGYSMAGFGSDENKLDEKTRLKLDALEALGENTDDEKAYTTLKDIALDTKQSLALRKQALNQLSGFKTHDVDAIYLDLVKKDTSEEIQIIAIENIGQTGQDKVKTVQTLEQLYASLPADRSDQRATALYRIADVGNDQAVDFLTRVARNDADYDLRSDAVYYLGNIGGDKARAVLYEILKGE